LGVDIVPVRPWGDIFARFVQATFRLGDVLPAIAFNLLVPLINQVHVFFAVLAGDCVAADGCLFPNLGDPAVNGVALP